MWKAVKAGLEALSYGKELSNAATWKNVQILTNVLAGLLGAAAMLAPEGVGLDNDTVYSIAAGFANAIIVFNAYLATATSKRVGV